MAEEALADVDEAEAAQRYRDSASKAFKDVGDISQKR
jgi:hypothetical protein